MLLAVAYIAGGNGPQRFGYFLLSFGIWDVFYYVFLKVLIGWPESLLTWDVLFLIPLTWVGPGNCSSYSRDNYVCIGMDIDCEQ